MVKDWSNDPERVDVSLWFSGEFGDDLRLAELPSGKFVIRNADGNTVGSQEFLRPMDAKTYVEGIQEAAHDSFMDLYAEEADSIFGDMIYEGRDPTEVVAWREVQTKAVKSEDPQEIADTFGGFGAAVEFMRRQPREDN